MVKKTLPFHWFDRYKSGDKNTRNKKASLTALGVRVI